MHFLTDDSDLAQLERLGAHVPQAVDAACRAMAQGALDHAVELAHARLHSRRDAYLQALGLREEDGAYIVALQSSAAWIEDGLDPHDMAERLLSSPKARVSRDGHRYLVVPMRQDGPGHSPAPRTAAASLTELLRSQLAQAGVGPDLDRHSDGSPKLGLVRRVDLASPRPMGSPHGYLSGVSVYQRAVGGSVVREALTFRTVSDRSRSGSWQHPGLDGVGIMEEARRWAEEQWERVVLPELLSRVVRSR